MALDWHHECQRTWVLKAMLHFSNWSYNRREFVRGSNNLKLGLSPIAGRCCVSIHWWRCLRAMCQAGCRYSTDLAGVA